MVVSQDESSDFPGQAQTLPYTIVDLLIVLQVLDILTTLLGMQMGAQKAACFWSG